LAICIALGSREIMVSTRRQKQALAAASNPLRNAVILKQLFTFLPGHHLFLGGVCREWRAVYAGMADQEVRAFSLYDSTELVTYGSKTTLFSAAVASPARARLACECGLEITEIDVQLIAGKYADIQTLAALRELGMPLSEHVAKAAAVSGRLTFLQHLLMDLQCPRPQFLSYCAAYSGSISMLNWLRDEAQCKFDLDTCTGAIRGNQLAALKYLRSEGCELDAANVAHFAALYGSVEMVEWLQQQQGIVTDTRELNAAAGAGRTAVCELLRSTGCDWSESVCTEAAKGDHLETLRWLREIGCPWSVTDVLDGAAFWGCNEVLPYVIEQSGTVVAAELLTRALSCAGASDQLKTVKLLRKHGAQWPAELCGVGRFPGQWYGKSLAWARAQGCTSPI
jgi:hypothetical protein